MVHEEVHHVNFIFVPFVIVGHTLLCPYDDHLFVRIGDTVATALIKYIERSNVYILFHTLSIGPNLLC